MEWNTYKENDLRLTPRKEYIVGVKELARYKVVTATYYNKGDSVVITKFPYKRVEAKIPVTGLYIRSLCERGKVRALWRRLFMGLSSCGSGLFQSE